ncbi:TetR/AcrR family transcriptional regulator [Aquabacterium sp. J223]|uniref:TetR/AcrR family transcriptional regulator n=1 Tax=Aquabacterium sp. J223 TaxID=2898431 RepID=UPI0021ADAE27|nr:TetR/AcrR family transcriptional regulator [Aquabacterium sp. J223]UUX96400.1 TetR family transcriptional regulator [Aquabacterium sp. J223]
MTTAAKTARRARPAESARARFLDAAERLFSERGYDGTSVRAIAEAAGANLGALHYYWGSKEALLEEMCERRLRPVAEERIRRLDECLVRAAGGVPDLREVLEAFLAPALLHEDQSEQERQQVGRLLACLNTSAAPEVLRVRANLIDETSLRTVRLLRQACPQLDDESFYWRLHAVFGTLQHAVSSRDRLQRLSRGAFDGLDQRRGLDELIAGLCTLMSAPPQRTSRPSARKNRNTA